MKEIRLLLLTFVAILLMSVISVLEEELHLPLAVSMGALVVLLSAVAVGVVRTMGLWPRPTAPPRPLAKGVNHEVRFDDAAIVVLRDGVEVERVAWADLLSVAITIEDHVFLTVPWWRLFGRGGATASYPSHAGGNEEMLRELQRRLPGFDDAAVVRAMGTMDGGVVVWERPVGAEQSGPA